MAELAASVVVALARQGLRLRCTHQCVSFEERELFRSSLAEGSRTLIRLSAVDLGKPPMAAVAVGAAFGCRRSLNHRA